MYKATSSPSGFVNNVKVCCSQCGASLYVNPNQSRSGWECPRCGKRH